MRFEIYFYEVNAIIKEIGKLEISSPEMLNTWVKSFGVNLDYIDWYQLGRGKDVSKEFFSLGTIKIVPVSK